MNKNTSKVTDMKKIITKLIWTFAIGLIIYVSPKGLLEPLIKICILVFVFILGYWCCLRLHQESSSITCCPEKNIHIFDEGKSVCQCWGTMDDGTKFSIPIRKQKI